MKLPHVDKKSSLMIGLVIAIGAIVLAFILLSGKSETKEKAGEPAGKEHAESRGHADGEHHGEAKAGKHHDGKDHADAEHHGLPSKTGVHGGKLFVKGDLGVEVLLAEEGGIARHRLWFFEKSQPLAPGSVTVEERLKRPLGAVQDIKFTVDKDSQLSAVPIAEPHIFDAQFTVRRAAEVMQFTVQSEEGKIEISDAQLKTAGIVIAKAAPASIGSAFQLQGEIRFNEDRTAHVVPRLGGVVESVMANLGQDVKKGQVLAVIASSEVSQMRSDLLSAQRRQSLAQTTFEREKKLWEEKISAEQDYLQARQALQEAEIVTQNARQKLSAVGASAGAPGVLNRYELRAPFDGAIVEKHIALGEAVKEDANVFLISDLSSVWAEIIVPAKDLGLVRVGEKALVKATSMDQNASGTVTYVGSLLGEQTRTAKARVTLANPKTAWRPGLFVNVELITEKRDVPVAIPVDAIQSLDGKPTVFVRIDGGFIAQPVELGRSDGKYTEVRSGLAVGTPYAAAGSFVIKAEQGKSSAEHAH